MIERACRSTSYISTTAEPHRGRGAAVLERRVQGGGADGARRGGTDELIDLIGWLGELCGGSTRASSRSGRRSSIPRRLTRTSRRSAGCAAVLTNRRAFLVLVRNELFRRVQLAALQSATMSSKHSTPTSTGGRARRLLRRARRDRCTGGPRASRARDDRRGGCRRTRGLARRQTLDDPAGDHDWRSAPRSTWPHRRSRAPRSCGSPRSYGSDQRCATGSCASARLGSGIRAHVSSTR